MKRKSLILGLSLAALGTLAASESLPSERREIVQFIDASSTGQEAMANLRLAYESGSYEDFLASLEADYQTLINEGSFDEFVQMREAFPEDEKLESIAREWEAQHKGLIAERNAKLLSLCEDSQEETLCKRIASLTSELPNDQKQAFDYLSSLRLKTPEMAANADERALIEIDLASEFKMIHLDAEHAAKPMENRADLQSVLRMDMLKQMNEAAKSFQDETIQKNVALANEGIDALQARIWDLNKLNTMSKKPSTDLEKAIAATLQEYKERSQDLYQKEFLAKM